MAITFNESPKGKLPEEKAQKMLSLIEDRNKAVAAWFKVDPKDFTANVYASTGSLRFKLDPNGEALGVFGGYVDNTDEIELISPDSVETIFGDNLDKEMSKLVDYCLVKFYLCKKYFPERKDFKMYHKYVSDVLSNIVSEKLQTSIAEFDIKGFSEDRHYKKDKELEMIFYIMMSKGSLDFIFDNLDLIMKECDIRKTTFEIYKKSFIELITQVQRELQERDKNLNKVFRPGRVR